MVRLSSLDGDPVPRIISEPGGRRRSGRSRRNRWPVFGGGRARSERSYGEEEDVYSYATSRRAGTDLLYGTGVHSESGRRSPRAYSVAGGGGAGGHIHTRFNPNRGWREGDDIMSERSHRSRRSRAWSRSQPSLARTLMSHISRRRGREGAYLDSPQGGSRHSLYADDNPNFREDVDYTRATYPRFVVVGWAHMVIGFFLILIGLVDIGWTASKYEGDCDWSKDDTFNGCGTDNIYTYIAAPLWGGLVMIFVGILTFMMTPYRLMYNTWLVYVFLGGCFFLLMAICPTIITMSVLLITENKNMFWADDADKGIILQDEAKFAFAIVIIILALLDFVVAIISILIGIFCPPQTETNAGKDPYASRSYRSYVDAPASGPAVVIPEGRRSRSSRRNYPSSVPEIIVSEEVVKPRSARSDAGRGGSRPGPSRAPPLKRGDKIVHEERLRPGGSRGGSHYGDDESYYSRDRRSDRYSDRRSDRYSDGGYARSEDVYRGGRRGLARSDYS